MIKLQGSEKQIAWANFIRERILKCLDFKKEAIKISHPNQLEKDSVKAWIAMLEEVETMLKAEESAKWFIGRKDAVSLYGENEYWDISFNTIFSSSKSHKEYEENIKKYEAGLKLENILTSNKKFMDAYRAIWAETSPDERKPYYKLKEE